MEDESSRLLQKILSPAEAQSLVMPPPDHPPTSAPGVSTPLTGNLAKPPSQATPARLQCGVQPVRAVVAVRGEHVAHPSGQCGQPPRSDPVRLPMPMPMPVSTPVAGALPWLRG